MIVMVSGNEVKKAMDVFGITDVHMEFVYVKKLHKQLLLKWHPDSCPEGKTEEYTKRSAEINAAFDILEKAYEIGMMGPGVKDFREEASSERANDNTTNTNNHQKQNTYNTYEYYRDLHERQQREFVRREYERRNNMYLLHNAVWNFIFYAICIRHIYRTFTEIDLGYKNMYIKETPYYFSVLIFVFYLLKSMYVTIVLDSGETEYFSIFCMIYLPLSFIYPIVYTFLHGAEAAMIFSLYSVVWAVFEWLMNIKIYEKVMCIGTIKGKKVSLPLVFFGAEEVIVIVFGIYVAIAAIYIK